MLIPHSNYFLFGDEADFGQDGRPVYIEQLGKVDINAMYKITTQERLLQNLVNEYEKFDDPRLVMPAPPFLFPFFLPLLVHLGVLPYL
jgi:hypothetical protein